MSEQRSPKAPRRSTEAGTPISAAHGKDSRSSKSFQNRQVAAQIKSQLIAEDRRRRINPDEITLSPTESDIEDRLNDQILSDSTRGLHIHTQDMSKNIAFYGKPGQLDDVLTYVDLQFALGGVTEHSVKIASLASLYRGSALTWLTSSQAHKTKDYEEFVEQTRQQFGLSKEAELGKLQRQLTSLRQTGSVQKFALQYRDLVQKTGTPEGLAKAQFVSKLKPQIQRALITNNDDDTSFQATIDEAIRLDSEFYNVRQSGSPGSFGPKHSTKRDGKGRFKSIKRESD